VARVLVIDDDPGTLDTFRLILRLAGHLPTVAATGEQALVLGQAMTADLILADIRLPDMDGLDVIRRLRCQRVPTPFVVMTAFPSIESAVEAGRLGAAAYLAKPLFDDDLLSAVTAHASEGTDAGSDVTPGAYTNRYVTQAMKIIDVRYAESTLSEGMVAREVNVSPEYLCRLIKHHTGQTFQATLLWRRIKQAHVLLRTTALRIKEIAGRSGFSDTSHFDHAFTRSCGLTPTEYRRRHSH